MPFCNIWPPCLRVKKGLGAEAAVVRRPRLGPNWGSGGYFIRVSRVLLLCFILILILILLSLLFVVEAPHVGDKILAQKEFLKKINWDSEGPFPQFACVFATEIASQFVI
jgi:hypothetical protein